MSKESTVFLKGTFPVSLIYSSFSKEVLSHLSGSHNLLGATDTAVHKADSLVSVYVERWVEQEEYKFTCEIKLVKM